MSKSIRPEIASRLKWIGNGKKSTQMRIGPTEENAIGAIRMHIYAYINNKKAKRME